MKACLACASESRAEPPFWSALSWITDKRHLGPLMAGFNPSLPLTVQRTLHKRPAKFAPNTCSAKRERTR